MITKLLSLALCGCAGVLLGTSISEDTFPVESPYFLEVEPETGWSDMDLRAIACEASVRIIHQLPMADLQRAAGFLRYSGRVLADSPESELLQIVQSGHGDRPARTSMFPRGEGVQDWVPISQYSGLSRGQ